MSYIFNHLVIYVTAYGIGVILWYNTINVTLYTTVYTASYRKLSLLCILVPDERVIYHTDNGMWRLKPTAVKITLCI